MPKYSVPHYYVVWVDVEADTVEDARDKASEVPYSVSVSHGLSVEFNDSGLFVN